MFGIGANVGTMAGLGAVAPITAMATGAQAAQAYMSYKNYKLQEAKYAHDKRVQNIEWSREDNAVQRRVADLEAAGLSKTLAAGSAASAGPVVSTVAPQIDGRALQASDAAALMQMAQGIATSKAQEQLLVQQARKASVDAAISLRELDLARRAGTSINPSMPGKLWRDIKEAIFGGGVIDNTSAGGRAVIQRRLDEAHQRNIDAGER